VALLSVAVDRRDAGVVGVAVLDRLRLRHGAPDRDEAPDDVRDGVTRVL